MGSITADLPEVLTETRLNINHNVKVALTPRGLEVLRERVRELNFFHSDVSDDQVEESIKLHYWRGDTYIFQMYEFMAIFGSSLPTFATSDARYNLFEQNNIVLIPDRF